MVFQSLSVVESFWETTLSSDSAGSKKLFSRSSLSRYSNLTQFDTAQKYVKINVIGKDFGFRFFVLDLAARLDASGHSMC